MHLFRCFRKKVETFKIVHNDMLSNHVNKSFCFAVEKDLLMVKFICFRTASTSEAYQQLVSGTKK